MLAGLTSMGFGESMLVFVVGMSVVMLELLLLALFVKLLAKAVGLLEGRTKNAVTDSPSVSVPNPVQHAEVQSVSVEQNLPEMAAALAASMAACGIRPEGNKTLILNAQKIK